LSISAKYWQNSSFFPKLPRRDLECGASSRASAGGSSLSILAALLGACWFAFIQGAPLHAQDHKSKVPIVGKLSSGNRQAAYSGKVQSVDMKQRILNVNALGGPNTEIFPFKKNVRIENLNGGRMGLSALTPGTAVLIYFNQKSGERTIKNIVVLSSGKEQAKGKPAPSS
jgi:hypothetical protein